MSESFICPRTGEACLEPELCGEVNAPLHRVVPRVRQEVGGVALNLTRRHLEHEIDHQADIRSTSLYPSFDSDGSGRVCPIEYIRGDIGSNFGAQAAASTMAMLVEKCVSNATEDLISRKHRFKT